MTDREVMQQALEALEELDGLDTETECVTIDVGDVITALRTALEQQAELTCPECKAAVLYECVACSSNNYPPQRQWQGLEAEDLAQIESDEFWQTGNHMAIAVAVEAKLKERNT